MKRIAITRRIVRRTALRDAQGCVMCGAQTGSGAQELSSFVYLLHSTTVYYLYTLYCFESKDCFE
jgi:hypothetical protein